MTHSIVVRDAQGLPLRLFEQIYPVVVCIVEREEIGLVILTHIGPAILWNDMRLYEQLEQGDMRSKILDQSPR
jgi:hypothetical protein